MSKSKPKSTSSPHRRRTTLIVWALLLGSIASIAAWYLWHSFQQFADRPLHDRPDPVVILVPQGSGLHGILDQLATAGLDPDPRWRWQLLLRQSGLAGKLKSGEYAIPRRLTPRGLLVAIAEGKVVQHRVTIFEGTRFKDLRLLLAQQPALTQTLTGLSDEEVLKRIGSTRTHAEGWFLPETYFYPRGFTDLDLLKRAYWEMEKALAAAWEGRAKDLPLDDPYQALILASIVEKETGKASERPTIAGVFIRRMKLGMRLQTDPTVIYGLGDAFDGNLRRRDLLSDTPYNTYTRAGLPPTPIALPGRKALEAAVHPDNGKSLYFVSRGDGSHAFSETLQQHNSAVAKFQLGR